MFLFSIVDSPKGPGPIGPILGDSFKEVISCCNLESKYVTFSQKHILNILEGRFSK